jgi:mono/diheme cytochrome c family protein
MSTQARRGLIFIGLIVAVLLVGLLFTYQVIRIPFPSDMTDSIAVDYQEGPRLAPPEGAVPIQGEAIIPDEIPINPIPADEVSLQRGEILFNNQCAVCHGETGMGDGPLAGYFPRPPANLAGERATTELDAGVFLAITQGFGLMPSLGENLTVRERWDVVNYVRTLSGSGE